MGVHGLWRLIEPSGKPVPLETLENKILAVDISIWLHQAVKGFQDARGAALPNAHLLGIYHRLCKLLYFRIKPVFIFDGGVPALKKKTIAKRHQHSTVIRNDATSIQQKILSTLLKHSAIQKVLSEKTNTDATVETISNNTKSKDDIFQLPTDIPVSDLDTTVDSDTSETSDSSPSKHQWDLHTIDEKSVHFTSLPAEVRHDILTDLKEQRKQSSWGRLHELPKQSGDFSSYQMKRLLKRYSVQVSLEETTKEMGGHTLSLNELEALLTEEGIVTASKTSTRRIASDENKSYLLIKDVKKAMEKAKMLEENLQESSEEKIHSKFDNANEPDEESSELVKDEEMHLKDEETHPKDEETQPKDDEYERDLKAAIELSLMDTPSTSKDLKTTTFDYFENLNDGDFVSDSESDDCTKSSKYVFSAAESYMLEFSDLTPHEIAKIVNKDDSKKSNKKNKSKIDEYLVTNLSENTFKTDNLKNEDVITIHEKSSINTENIKNQELNQPEIIELNCDKTENELNFFKTNLIEDELKPENTGFNSPILIENASSVESQNDTNDKIEILSDSDGSDFVEVAEINNKIDSRSDSEKIDKESHINTKLSENKMNTPENKDTPNIVNAELINDRNEVISVETKLQDVQKEVLEVMTDSDDSDFVEVEENNCNIANQKSAIEVVINPISNIEDDIFSDIFSGCANENESKNISDILKKDEIMKSTNEIQMKQISELTIPNQTFQITDEKEETNRQIKEMANENINSHQIVSEPTSKPKKVVENKPKLTVEELNKLQSELIQDERELIAERNAKERMASDITHQMYQEAQELLEIFGVPYIIAPMEAEAQCAFLNCINLTDGTITDDSDIWLFGGQTVYKNFFNQKKHVMEYRAEKIKQYFKLSREQMILLALLVGSDYTLGISGIGPVTALEILSAFPPAKNVEISILSQNELISGLSEFKHWLTDGRNLGPGRTTLRSKLQNINISEGFPSAQVVQAYLEPEVETCRDAFSWGKPDFVELIAYAREKFGWTRLKSEEILNPVIKKLAETGKQKSIKDYFATKHKVQLDLPEGKMSKRVKVAVERMGKSKEELKKEVTETSKTNRKGTGKRKVNTKNLTTESEKKDDVVDEELVEPEKRSRRRVNIDILKTDKPKKQKHESTNKDIVSKPKLQKKKDDFHKEEKIPQREYDKIYAIKSKLRAIEVFRKSKIDKKSDKKRKPMQKPKDEADLSESSDSSEFG